MDELLKMLTDRFSLEPDKVEEIVQSIIHWLKDHPEHLTGLLGNIGGLEGLADVKDLGDVGNLVGKLFSR